MARFDEDGYQQLLKNQANAERELKKPQPKRKAATHRGGATPKPMPERKPLIERGTGRELSVCPACEAHWGDCLRQFTNGGVDMFHCHCKPLRSFERYKEAL